MFKNEVILRVGGDPWTISGLCFVAAFVCVVLWGVLLPVIAKRMGTIRSMTAAEAAQFTFAGTDRSYIKPRPQIAGPAAGREWRVNISIGDLRGAWHEQRYLMFFGAPIYMLLFAVAFGFVGLGLAYSMERPMPGLVFLAPLALFILMYLFMMWAAVYTQLE